MINLFRDRSRSFMAAVPVLLASFQVLAQDPCNVDFEAVSPTCPGDADGSLTIVGAPGQYTYIWDHDPGLNGPAATDLAAGLYPVIVTDTSGCISYIDAIVLDPVVPPLGTFTVTHISCAGLSDGAITFNLNPGLNNTWFWWHDPSLTDNTITGLGAGPYGVHIEDPGSACDSEVWTLLGDPDVVIEGTADYCPGDPPLLTLEMEFGFQPDLYEWSTGDVTSSLQVTPGLEGLVEVTAIDTSSGCEASGELTLTQLPAPTVLFAAPDSMCQNAIFTVEVAETDADSIEWRWDGGSVGYDSLQTVSFAQPFWRPISLQGFYQFGCGSAPLQDSIYIHPIKPANFTVQQIPCSPVVMVDLASDADSCAFFIGDSLVTNECSISFLWDHERYRVYDYVFHSTQINNCNDSADVTVDVRTEPTLFLPTAFSPNDDGINDEWPGPVDVPELGYELRLFDRWGTDLWSTKDPQMKWNGSEMPNGVYIYTMQMRDPCEPTSEVSKAGHVILVR